MPHGPVVMFTFPTVQGCCRGWVSFVTTCPEEVHPTCHATWRLMRSVSAWAAMATNREVALMFEIPDNTVRRYDKIVLKTDTPPPMLDGLTKLLIDEKAVRKGHGYVTVILNGNSGDSSTIAIKGGCNERWPTGARWHKRAAWLHFRGWHGAL